MNADVRVQLISHRQSVRSFLDGLGSNFAESSTQLDTFVRGSAVADADTQVLKHLRTCGAIPEEFGHDSTQEKLFAKYTDSVLAEALRCLGATAEVLSQRGDAADVIATAGSRTLVGDAKAFRLSRTAKNQKDFKVDALGGRWRGNHAGAILVCPSSQLPARSSQIYASAGTQSVLILTYAHLAAAIVAKGAGGSFNGIDLISQWIEIPVALQPSKDAQTYWTSVFRTTAACCPNFSQIWVREKQIAAISLDVLKNEGLTYLRRHQAELLTLDREEAIRRLTLQMRLQERMTAISGVVESGVLEFGR